MRHDVVIRGQEEALMSLFTLLNKTINGYRRWEVAYNLSRGYFIVTRKKREFPILGSISIYELDDEPPIGHYRS